MNIRIRFIRPSALLAGVLLAATLSPAQAEIKRITIGTNPQGTTYYVIGGGFSKLFSDKLRIRASAQPHAGSSVYLPLVEAGEVTLGLSSSLDSSMAYRGVGGYPKAGLKKLRALAQIWALPYTLFARADSGLKTIADLKGKKVAIEMSANAALGRANKALLAAGGLNPDSDVNAVTVTGIPEGFKLVADGSIDAAATALGIPLARKAHATWPGGIVMLGLDGAQATSGFISKQFPGMYVQNTKPGKNNPGVDSPRKVTGFDIFVVASESLSDADAYRLTKTLHQHWDAVKADYPPLRRTQSADLSKPSNTIPFHPGAVRYFQEIGQWTDKNDKHESSFNQ